MPYKDPEKRKQATNRYNQEYRELIQIAKRVLDIQPDRRIKQK